MKNSSTRIGQDKAELTLEIMGAQGLGWEGEDFTPEERRGRARLALRRGDNDLRRLV